ncbi:hypothetical protein [Kitasatospora sp. NPDC051914]|uniref:hypothetical protein n=1 Tax=Kitasatospora sp. NPDC051914 TaxID=3154945 RepID=UPI0034229DBC
MQPDRHPAPAAAAAEAAAAAGRRPAPVPPLLPQAEHLALTATLAGQQVPEAWLENIPAPDEDDTGQQHLYRRLVAAVAHWRLRHHVSGDDPLGPPPDGPAHDEWQHLAQALDLYQRARIEDRLQLLRLRRDADRERLEAAARQAAATPTARTPAARPARPAQRGRPSRPRRPGGRGRR